MMIERSPAAPLRIVGLGGSLAPKSTSLGALRAVLARAEAAGAHTQLFDVRRLGLPMYDRDAEPPATARRLAATVHAADALVLSSPLYHGTISGAFKNALDWLDLLAREQPPYLTNKPVALIATAGGVQGLQAINTMEFVVRALRGWTIPFTLPIAHAHEVFTEDGAFRDPALEKQTDVLAHEILAAARRFAPSPIALTARS